MWPDAVYGWTQKEAFPNFLATIDLIHLEKRSGVAWANVHVKGIHQKLKFHLFTAHHYVIGNLEAFLFVCLLVYSGDSWP